MGAAAIDVCLLAAFYQRVHVHYLVLRIEGLQRLSEEAALIARRRVGRFPHTFQTCDLGHSLDLCPVLLESLPLIPGRTAGPILLLLRKSESLRVESQLLFLLLPASVRLPVCRTEWVLLPIVGLIGPFSRVQFSCLPSVDHSLPCVSRSPFA